MFEVSGDDIKKLSDADLRSLVTRLAVAELRLQGYPRASVTAGGNQDAADGGIDVRVECPSEISNPDFVPRRLTGFQVKKPDMPPRAIRDEMRPKGIVRDAIRELADASGAYVIVSGQGSVADKPLADRRKAMRDALKDVSSAPKLHTDFYDRDRLATWVNEYPGVASWVRDRAGHPLSGWSGVHDWENPRVSSQHPFLVSEKTCLRQESDREPKALTVDEGIARLRQKLNVPGQCTRLVGLSGVGKTRLVQALFEEGVGESALDSGLAIYTDYSQEPHPTARDMARELVADGCRAILIVDNCNPSNHAELARLCSVDGSKVSLLTVEYDVRGDETEQSEVFRLQSASVELVADWIKCEFPEVSRPDREKIAGFSNGNFRVAKALARTLKKGETLGSLKDGGLFERIFHQGKPHDLDLLKAAESLSLLYSIDGENVSDGGELECVASIRGNRPQDLYESLVEMGKREVVQSRGRFRAILPQAIANWLAASALDRIPPGVFDEFCKRLPRRGLISVSRRLGLLHDSTKARETVTRWLRKDGPQGDLLAEDEDLRLLANIAPVAPEETLRRLEGDMLPSENGLTEVSFRHDRIRLIKAIAYEAGLFERAVLLLARFLPQDVKNEHNHVGLRAFRELFHVHLSGTLAAPEQRRAVVRVLARSSDAVLSRCAIVASRAMLESNGFMVMGGCDFGARPRDWGWHPKTGEEVSDWYEKGISLVVELFSEMEARSLLASNARGLWRYPSCRRLLDRMTAEFLNKGPWVEGWIAFRATLYYDGKNMSPEVRRDLEELIGKLKPKDLLNRARAFVLAFSHGAFDLEDYGDAEGAGRPSERIRKAAREIGQALAIDDKVRREFLAELFNSPQAPRAYECGIGLAEGADDLKAIWAELLVSCQVSEITRRAIVVLGGFLEGANRRDPEFVSDTLNSALDDNRLLNFLPDLQRYIGLNIEGVDRLKSAIARGAPASSFRNIGGGSLELPAEELGALVKDLAAIPDGAVVALDILDMRFDQDLREGRQRSEILVSLGAAALAQVDFAASYEFRDYSLGEMIRACLGGAHGRKTSAVVCSNVRQVLDESFYASVGLDHTLKALFRVQPEVALDAFLLPKVAAGVGGNDLSPSPISAMPFEVLREWANIDPGARYPLLAECVDMFGGDGGENKPSALFLLLLDQAPDKQGFLGNWWDRLVSQDSDDLLADRVRKRRDVLVETYIAEPPWSEWLNEALPQIDAMIEQFSRGDRHREESFE